MVATSATPTLLRRDHVRPLGSRNLLQLRLETLLEPAVDPVEIDVNHWRDGQRQQLRQAQTADPGDAQGLAQPGPRTRAAPDPPGPANPRKTRPHHRPEPQQ